MFDIQIALMRGFAIGINYSNEDLENIEVIADDMRHTIQIIFFVIIININYFLPNEE